MLGFWRKGLRPAAGPVDTSSVPSPCMRRVFSTAMSSCTNTSGKQLTKKGQPAVEAEQRMSGTCWTSLFSEAPPLRHEAKPVPVVAEVLQVSPPWVAVGPPAIDEAEDEAPRDHGLEFVGSYFLDIEPSALRDRLLYPPACHDVPARSQGGSGKLEVEFISLEELSRLRGEV